MADRRVRRRRQTGRTKMTSLVCEQCEVRFVGRADRRFCSRACYDNRVASQIQADLDRGVRHSIRGTVKCAVAARHGCEPGQSLEVACQYCDARGTITWWLRKDGSASDRVVLQGLEWDHVVPWILGGGDDADNLVLACRYCNRSRKHWQRHPKTRDFRREKLRVGLQNATKSQRIST